MKKFKSPPFVNQRLTAFPVKLLFPVLLTVCLFVIVLIVFVFARKKSLDDRGQAYDSSEARWTLSQIEDQELTGEALEKLTESEKNMLNLSKFKI